MPLTPEDIQSAIAANRIKWQYHALLRFRERGITREQAKYVLSHGQIIERDDKARPFPKCLMVAMIQPNRPLYVAVAINDETNYIHVITVHWLDPEKWEDPCCCNQIMSL